MTANKELNKIIEDLEPKTIDFYYLQFTDQNVWKSAAKISNLLMAFTSQDEFMFPDTTQTSDQYTTDQFGHPFSHVDRSHQYASVASYLAQFSLQFCHHCWIGEHDANAITSLLEYLDDDNEHYKLIKEFQHEFDRVFAAKYPEHILTILKR